MKKSLIFSLFLILLCSFSLFAQEDNTIDIEGIIDSKEAERQTLQKLSKVLDSVQGNFKEKAKNIASFTGLLKGEDGEISFDDNSEESSIDSFIKKIKDGSWKDKIYEYIDDFGVYLGSINNEVQSMGNTNLWSPFSCIVFVVISLLFSIVICSVSTVSAVETTQFEIIRKNKQYQQDLEEKSNFKEVVAPKVIPVTFSLKEKPAKKIEPAQDSPFKITYNREEWLELGKGALLELGSYSGNKEFKNVYSYFQKKTMVMNPRPFDIAIAEADKAIPYLENNQSGEESILSSIIKAKSSDKYAGIGINKINPSLTSMDVAYLLSLSENTNDSSKTDLWSANSWN